MKRHSLETVVVLFAVTLLCGGESNATELTSDKPMNILFLVADDLNSWLLEDPDRYPGKHEPSQNSGKPYLICRKWRLPCHQSDGNKGDLHNTWIHLAVFLFLPSWLKTRGCGARDDTE